MVSPSATLRVNRDRSLRSGNVSITGEGKKQRQASGTWRYANRACRWGFKSLPLFPKPNEITSIDRMTNWSYYEYRSAREKQRMARTKELGYFQRIAIAQQIAVNNYRLLGYVVKEDFDFSSSQHPTEKAVWLMALDAVDIVVKNL